MVLMRFRMPADILELFLKASDTVALQTPACLAMSTNVGRFIDPELGDSWLMVGLEILAAKKAVVVY